jgi:phage shock protein C
MSKKAEGQLMGVCATIANKTGVDVFIIRLITVLLALFTWGGVTVVYFLLGLFASEA